MNKKEYEERINALQNEINSLKEELNQIQDEIPDYPVFDNQQSWAMNPTLELYGCSIAKCNTNDNDINHDFNLFHEKYFAEEFAKKCKFIAMLLHCKQYLCPTYFPNFRNDEENKWVVCYDYASNTFEITCWSTYWESQVYFDTKENAQKAADWMKEHFKFS